MRKEYDIYTVQVMNKDRYVNENTFYTLDDVRMYLEEIYTDNSFIMVNIFHYERFRKGD